MQFITPFILFLIDKEIHESILIDENRGGGVRKERKRKEGRKKEKGKEMKLQPCGLNKKSYFHMGNGI